MKRVEIAFLVTLISGLTGLMTFALTRKHDETVEKAVDSTILAGVLILLLIVMVGGLYFAI